MFEAYVSKNCKVAVSFSESYTRVDPRSPYPQWVTTCLVRPLKSRHLETYCGVTICHPHDHISDDIARKVSLTRALGSMLPDLDPRACSHLARTILRSQKLLEEAAAAGETVVEFVSTEAANA